MPNIVPTFFYSFVLSSSLNIDSAICVKLPQIMNFTHGETEMKSTCIDISPQLSSEEIEGM